MPAFVSIVFRHVAFSERETNYANQNESIEVLDDVGVVGNNCDAGNGRRWYETRGGGCQLY